VGEIPVNKRLKSSAVFFELSVDGSGSGEHFRGLSFSTLSVWEVK
jgi:hypothetical protein